ncbi:hypothetical protein, partial [Dokdonella sp.]|uniref:hypothetical protein n=1 Tax=Dokdonella sp. TaxID=2291710 RepID=UPI002625D1E3
MIEALVRRVNQTRGMVRRMFTRHILCLALRAASLCKTAILPFCHSGLTSGPRPTGSFAVQNGNPAVLSLGAHILCLALRAASLRKTAILPFCHSEHTSWASSLRATALCKTAVLPFCHS